MCGPVPHAGSVSQRPCASRVQGQDRPDHRRAPRSPATTTGASHKEAGRRSRNSFLRSPHHQGSEPWATPRPAPGRLRDGASVEGGRHRSPDSSARGEGRHLAPPLREWAGIRCKAPERGARPGARGTLQPPPRRRAARLGSPPAPRGWRGGGGGGEEVVEGGRTRSGLAAGLHSARAGGWAGGAGDRRSSPLAFERSSWANGRRGDAPGLVQALC